jgi:hypothetical protein
VGYLFAQPHQKSMRIAYQADDPSLRTRCPGPLSSDLSTFGTVASAVEPLAALRRSRLVVRFRSPRRFSGQGYAGTITPDLKLVLVRKSIRERVITERIPVFP